MIPSGAKLSIRRIPLSQLHVTETEACYPERFALYLQLLLDHPELDVDPLVVRPSGPSMFGIRNGKHRFCSSIMAGRSDAWCLVVEEK